MNTCAKNHEISIYKEGACSSQRSLSGSILHTNDLPITMQEIYNNSETESYVWQLKNEKTNNPWIKDGAIKKQSG